jgi:hypothetical protein
VQIPVTSREYMYIPVSPPPAVPDVTVYPCEAALVADDGSEPADGDYHAASWIGGEVALLVGPGAVTYLPGDYMAFARLTAGLEQPVMKSGRVRIGEAG